jgi:hypothetical protein
MIYYIFDQNLGIIPASPQQEEEIIKREEYIASGQANIDRITDDLDNIKERLRLFRNTLLMQSDWTQMPDNQLPEEIKTEWAQYRQLLRDYPSTISDILEWDEPKWPIAPGTIIPEEPTSNM